jgi:hypothetical protein
MSFHQMTKIVGLNIADRQELNAIRAFRAVRGVVGILIAALGMYLIITQGAPAVWAAVQYIVASPTKLQAVEFSAIAGAATGGSRSHVPVHSRHSNRRCLHGSAGGYRSGLRCDDGA